MIRIKPKDKIKKVLFPMMVEAYKDYPILDGAFEDEGEREKAMELTCRFCGSYDIRYGVGVSCDGGYDDCIILLDSKELPRTEVKQGRADCFDRRVVEIFSQLPDTKRILWQRVLNRIDAEQAKLDLPERCIFVEFICVRPEKRGQGRAKALLKGAMVHAKSAGLPLVLYTVCEEHVEFYKSAGFEVLGETDVPEYDIHATYMIWGKNEQEG